ncbi:hypothetical protein IAT38_001719 [Cryptococcus sp. DSM 104549]
MSRPENTTLVTEAQKRADPELKNVVDFLRGKAGPKVRLGVLNGKRVDYFKGKTAIRTLLSPQYEKLKKVPQVKNEEEATALMVKILPYAFFLRTDRPTADAPPTPSGQPKVLRLAPQQSFDPLAYYSWFYDGSPLYKYLGGFAMVAIMLAGVMFPLWPVSMRIGVWYLSVGVLCLVGLLIVIAIVRLILWCITVVSMKRAIWIFPNLFEDVGFFDSFKPAWAWDEPAKKKKKARSTPTTKGKKATTLPALEPPAQGQAGIPGMPGVPGQPARAEAEMPDVPVAAAATGVNVGAGAGAAKNRHAATIEEIDDE